MPVLVAVRDSPDARGVGAARVRRWAERMLRALGRGRADLSVLLTDDREMRALNRRWRRRDRTTDVLAFAQREGRAMPGPARVLGDVVVCVAAARRQAAERGRKLDEEVCFLLSHGILHLAGWDHRHEREERAMGRRSAELCEAARRASRRQRGGRS